MVEEGGKENFIKSRNLKAVQLSGRGVRGRERKGKKGEEVIIRKSGKKEGRKKDV